MTKYLLREIDFKEVEPRSPHFYYSGILLEIYITYMVARDIIILTRNFFSSHKEAFWYAMACHYIATCFDFVALTALAVYTSINIKSHDTASCKDESPDCEKFYNIAFTNTVVAFCVLIGHCLIVPATLCALFLWPEFLRRELEEYNQSLLDPYSLAENINSD